MMDCFGQILRRMLAGNAYSSSIGIIPFKVQINFDITIFEGQINVDVVEKRLNLREGYFFVHNFFDREKIIFSLLKGIPHVKYWWETFYQKKATYKSTLCVVSPTWCSFKDDINEQYYPVGSYDELYTRSTTPRHEIENTMWDFTNLFNTLFNYMGMRL